MNYFNISSPPTNDPISKLQNLLNNSLSSLLDIFNNLSYVGEAKELHVEFAETSEYSEFAKQLKHLEVEADAKITRETVKEERDRNQKIEDENKNENPEGELPKEKKANDVFVKPHFDNSAKVEILDRVERFYLILEKINECIDELPDCSVSEKEKGREMMFLQKVKNEKMSELKELYNMYDYLYNSIRRSLRETTVQKD